MLILLTISQEITYSEFNILHILSPRTGSRKKNNHRKPKIEIHPNQRETTTKSIWERNGVMFDTSLFYAFNV